MYHFSFRWQMACLAQQPFTFNRSLTTEGGINLAFAPTQQIWCIVKPTLNKLHSGTYPKGGAILRSPFETRSIYILSHVALSNWTRFTNLFLTSPMLHNFFLGRPPWRLPFWPPSTSARLLHDFCGTHSFTFCAQVSQSLMKT